MLTVDERAWLKQHPDLRLAVRSNWPPFEFTENGKPRGLVLDLVKALRRPARLQVQGGAVSMTGRVPRTAWKVARWM